MEAHEAMENFESAHEIGHGSSLAKWAALTVAVVAAFLAVSTFLGNESVKEAIQGQTKVADKNAELQTFETQDLIFESDQLLLAVSTNSQDPDIQTAAQKSLKALAADAEKVPEEEKTRKEKVAEARAEVTEANDQHLRYEIAEVLLQIAIVLASVSIIASRRFLLLGGQTVAAVGVVVLVVGYAT